MEMEKKSSQKCGLVWDGDMFVPCKVHLFHSLTILYSVEIIYDFNLKDRGIIYGGQRIHFCMF